MSSVPTSRSSSPLPPALQPTASSSRVPPSPPTASSSRARASGSAEAQRRRKGAAEPRRARHHRNAPQTPYERVPDTRYSQDYREQSPHRVDFDATDLPKSGGGAWVGRRSKGSQRLYTLPELEREGYEYVEWNGRSVLHLSPSSSLKSLSSDPKLILDSEGRIIAVLLGTPDDADWADVVREAYDELRHARRYAQRHGLWSRTRHRRGWYFSITAGASFGGGQRRPGNLRNNRRIRRLLRRLLRNRAIRRIMGFQSMGFAIYAPKLYKYYCRILKALFEHHPELIQLFSNSIFPSATFNCGPDAVTFDHCDVDTNLAHGFCGVTSGGNFNHKRGGHMYLKQLRLVIEFPSGASMLIPSGCINHGNTPIAADETRHSMTQYAAGGLFRWAAYGFQTSKALLATEGGREAKERFDGVPGARWSWAINLFSKIDELEGDRAAEFVKS
ncbi:hypothetical protein C8R43DRAFT_889161 [Mycena crocata]|nr:hypothetical protein C8R43DRAFT_889161 [Mycena crocata]